MRNRLVKISSLLAALAVFASLTLVAAPAQAVGTTYYLDSNCTGCDSNTGTSSTSPWQTLSKASGHTFAPGDQLLLRAGATWSGQLTLNGSGTSSNPISIAAYGSGAKPVISNAGSGGALMGTNVSFWDISGLELVAATTQVLQKTDNFTDIISGHRTLNSGITVEFSGAGPYGGISVHDNDIHGSSYDRQSYGVLVDANYCSAARTTLVADGITLANNTVHDVGWAGIKVGGCSGSTSTNMTTANGVGYTNVSIIGNQVYNTAVQGVLMQATTDGVASNNLVHDIGRYTSGVSWPPAGLWILGTNRSQLSYNEVWNVSDSGTGSDAGGIDIDWENTNATVSHNYLHDNLGNGIETLANTGSTISYNRLERNAASTGTGHGAIALTGVSYDPSPRFTGVQSIDINHNNIRLSSTGTVALSTQFVSGQTWSGNSFHDNDVSYDPALRAYDVQSGLGLNLSSNKFHPATGSSFSALLNGSLSTSLTSWQSASGQDSASSVSPGVVWRASADFAPRQGVSAWSYQSLSGTTFADLPSLQNISGRWTWAGYTGETYLWVLPDNQHPGLNAASSRTWTAPSSGTVDVAGQVAKLDTGCGNGITASIYKNGNFSSPLFSQDVAYNDAGGLSTSLTGISVVAGDRLQFVVSSKGNVGCDRTAWDPTVTLHPSSLSVIDGVSLGTLRNNFTGKVGFAFTTGGATESVTSLGRYWLSSNTGSHIVSVVRASDSATLGSVVITPSTGSLDSVGFRNVTLSSPISLAPGTTYYVLTAEAASGDQWYDFDTTIHASTTRIVPTAVVYDDGSLHPSSPTYAGRSYGPVQLAIAP